ncbi:unnamed protein product [Taenia asiatica]|uniref:BTB domain-containing protein n=1 Tax=Taenia asiatica TaxID=60517 RepID=A0A158R6W1_TAEAS|nr:unnamed protein product [Taenia asiatica]
MESKKRRDGHSPQAASAATSLLPARFRCSLLDQLDRVAFTNETERYHLVGPKMGLGFCRFVERSRLYPPLGVDTESVAMPGRKDGPPVASATLTTDDHRLVGPGDRVKFFAEIFWIEEEIYTSASEDIPSSVDSTDDCDCPPAVQTSTDLQTDLERLLLSNRLADVKVTVGATATQQKCDGTVLVDIPNLSCPIACDCSDCMAPTQGALEFCAHKAILAASSPKLLRIFSSKNDGHLYEGTQKLVFCGSGLLPDVIPIFLRYAYTHRIDPTVSHTQLVSLLRLAYQLEMPDLAKLVAQRLGRVLSVQNACSILVAAVDMKTPQLADACLSYVFRHVCVAQQAMPDLEMRSAVIGRQAACPASWTRAHIYTPTHIHSDEMSQYERGEDNRLRQLPEPLHQKAGYSQLPLLSTRSLQESIALPHPPIAPSSPAASSTLAVPSAKCHTAPSSLHFWRGQLQHQQQHYNHHGDCLRSFIESRKFQVIFASTTLQCGLLLTWPKFFVRGVQTILRRHSCPMMIDSSA